MQLALLRAAVKMLEGCKPDKVDCAKAILTELITELEKVPAKKMSAYTYDSAGAIHVGVDEDLDPAAIAAKEELTG